MNDIKHLNIADASILLRKGELSSRELTEAYIASVESQDETIGAYLTFCKESALKEADAADKLIRKGDAPSILTGIPFALKDNICTKGVKTTCASKMLSDFVPPYDAHVCEKLKECGAVMLGKLNMDEFGMGSSTENSAMKKTVNPLDPKRVPGGSSGGCAAAVAAKEALFALGSDTGGSVRQPASFCGVVGMKPTYGTVSRYGLVAFASSLDQIGPMTRTVKDNAYVLEAICGKDKRDATSLSLPDKSFTSNIGLGVKGLKFALPKEYFGEGISDDVKKSVLAAAKKYEQIGAEVCEVSLPSTAYALSAYYIISSAEASSNLARFDGVRYGYRSESYKTMEELYKNSRSEAFGQEVKRRIMLGTFVLSSGYYDEYYKKAQSARSLVKKDFAKIFEKYDAVLSPVAPTVAYKLGENISDPLTMYMGDAYTVPTNIAGLPALSIPCGKGDGGMPVGLQLIGKAFSEKLLYRIAYAFECETKEG